MNGFTRDGMRWLKRASNRIANPPAGFPANDQLAGPEPADMIDDSILFFAFGIEKLLKGLLYDINPLFIYDDPGIENACAVLYRDKLVEGRKNAVGKAEQGGKGTKANHHVHMASTSLTNALNFSQTACNHTAALRQLFDYRGTIAHHEPKLIDRKAAIRFVRKNFSLIVESLVTELKLDVAQVIEAARRQPLVDMSAQIVAADDFVAKMDKLVADCKKAWEDKSKKPTDVKLADAETELSLERNVGPHQFKEKIACPACGQNAVLLCAVDGEYMDGEAVATGAFVLDLKCYHCGLVLHSYEEVDHFELDSKLYDLMTQN